MKVWRKETIRPSEKVIADLMVILRYHWGTRTDSLGRICDFISICKYSEYLAIVELENMPPRPAICPDTRDGSDPGSSLISPIPEPSTTCNPVWVDPFAPRSEISVKEDLMNERMDHILDQLGFLSNEEVILQEMHLICDERERLYEISRRLFLG